MIPKAHPAVLYGIGDDGKELVTISITTASYSGPSGTQTVFGFFFRSMQVHRERGIVVLLERQDETLSMAAVAIWRERRDSHAGGVALARNFWPPSTQGPGGIGWRVGTRSRVVKRWFRLNQEEPRSELGLGMKNGAVRVVWRLVGKGPVQQPPGPPSHREILILPFKEQKDAMSR